jgi:carboxylesterase
VGAQSRRGALVLHGFTATAREVQPLADALRRRGWETECPTLPGHGTSPRDLQRTTWRDWYGAAEQAFASLRARADRVAVCGLSMGGLLALRLAMERSDVGAVVALATPLWLRRGIARGARLLAPLMRYMPKGPPDISDPVERAAHVAYGSFPLYATASFTELMQEVHRRAAEVRVPTLIVHSKRDHVAPFGSSEYLAKHIPHARLRVFERSFHILTRDVEHSEVERVVIEFLEEVLP